MTIAESLTQLSDIKADIRSAIEAKGQSLTGVSFGGYAAKIRAISTGSTPPSPPLPCRLKFVSPDQYNSCTFYVACFMSSTSSPYYSSTVETITYPYESTGVTIPRGSLVQVTAASNIQFSVNFATATPSSWMSNGYGNGVQYRRTAPLGTERSPVTSISNSYSLGMGAYPSFQFPMLGDVTITTSVLCQTGDTLITLADGSQKRLDAITRDDTVLGLDPSTMTLVPQRIIYLTEDENAIADAYDLYVFSDGTELKTCHEHSFYSLERQRMQHISEWSIGDRCVRLDGTCPALVAHETVIGETPHYTLGVEHHNYFSNGVLTGSHWTAPMAIDNLLSISSTL